MFTLRNVMARSVALGVIAGIHFLCFGVPGSFDSDASIGHHANAAAAPQSSEPVDSRGK